MQRGFEEPRVFFSPDELSAAIVALLDSLNDRIIRRLGKSRRQLFERLARPPLRALPPTL